MAIHAATSLRVSNVQFSEAVKQLAKLVNIPSFGNSKSSCYDMGYLQAAGRHVALNLKELDFDVRLVSIENSTPYVIAKRMISKDLPTVTLISHYDVGLLDHSSHPCILSEMNGRLYGGGISEGKGGIIAILTALKVYKDAGKPLPVNVNVLFEGEHESPSNHRRALLKQEAENLTAMAFVAFCGTNINSDTGTLAFSTRGVVKMEIRVDATEYPIPGDDGCMVPNPAMHLAKLIASLDRPRDTIPAFTSGSNSPTKAERALLKSSSPSFSDHAEKMGMLPDVFLRSDICSSVYEMLVDQPWINVLNIKTGEANDAKSIPAYATVAIEVRTLPGQIPENVAETVATHVQRQQNVCHLKTSVTSEVGLGGWKAVSIDSFFKAYLTALSVFPRVGIMPLGRPIALQRDIEAVFPGKEILLPSLKDPISASKDSIEEKVFRRAIDSLIAFLCNAAAVEMET